LQQVFQRLVDAGVAHVADGPVGFYFPRSWTTEGGPGKQHRCNKRYVWVPVAVWKEARQKARDAT